MYENDFDEFNFKVLETETNEIIKKQDLKKLTCDILFELKKSPIKALFIASKNGFLNWSRGERTIYCLGMTLLDFEMVDTNKEVNILYNDVNRNVENFLIMCYNL